MMLNKTLIFYEKIRKLIFHIIYILLGYRIELLVKEKYYSFTSFISRRKRKVDSNGAYIVKKGRNNGKKYYIMRYSYPAMGFAAVMRDALLTDLWICREGFTLLIDYEEYDNYATGTWGKKENNIWEEYFVQSPTVEEVLMNSRQTDTIIAGSLNEIGKQNRKLFKKLNGNPKDCHVRCIGGKEGEEYRKVFREVAPKYLKLKQQYLDKFTDVYNRMFASSGTDKRVGVLMREIFIANNKKNVDEEHQKVLEYHPTHHSVEDTVVFCKKIMRKNDVNHLFLATLYEDTIRAFENGLGKNSVCYLERKRLNSYLDDEHDDLMKTDVHSYELKRYPDKKLDEIFDWNACKERNESYLQELFLLSKCEFFISGVCGGGFIVPLLKEGLFENIFYISNVDGGYSY